MNGSLQKQKLLFFFTCVRSQCYVSVAVPVFAQPDIRVQGLDTVTPSKYLSSDTTSEKKSLKYADIFNEILSLMNW